MFTECEDKTYIKLEQGIELILKDGQRLEELVRERKHKTR